MQRCIRNNKGFAPDMSPGYKDFIKMPGALSSIIQSPPHFYRFLSPVHRENSLFSRRWLSLRLLPVYLCFIKR